MPLNESTGIRTSNLTKQQRRDAERAIYGLPQESTLQQTISFEDIERMRELVRVHDSQGSKMQEFDLNKPPQAPYRYQEFPRIVYHHAKQAMRKVFTTDELDQHLAGGYSIEPFPSEVEELAPLEPAIAREAAAIDAHLKKRK